MKGKSKFTQGDIVGRVIRTLPTQKIGEEGSKKNKK